MSVHRNSTTGWGVDRTRKQLTRRIGVGEVSPALSLLILAEGTDALNRRGRQNSNRLKRAPHGVVRVHGPPSRGREMTSAISLTTDVSRLIPLGRLGLMRTRRP